MGAEETARLLWTQYHDALRRASALDFDDLLVLLARLLKEHPDVREKYRRRYQHILVDEYQDTNRAQYEIARLLTRRARQHFCGGRRGPEHLFVARARTSRTSSISRRISRDARVMRLEQNYRSTAPILAAANELVENNVSTGSGKTLYTQMKDGEPVRFYIAGTGEDEAEWVADEVTNLGDGREAGRRCCTVRTGSRGSLKRHCAAAA